VGGKKVLFGGNESVVGRLCDATKTQSWRLDSLLENILEEVGVLFWNMIQEEVLFYKKIVY
jgi:hypothetical protein